VKRFSIRFRSAASAAAIVLGVMALSMWNPPQAGACTTPVFRYAMYNWPAAPYYFFYFHHGEEAEQDKEVNKLLRELSEADPPANVRLDSFDVTKEDQLKRLPKVVLKAREENAKDGEPLHVVFTSWGAELYVGRLDVKTLRAMVDSPLRQKLGKSFHDGNATTLLILEGPDAKANKEAEKVCKQVAAKAEAGEIPVSSAFGDMYVPPPADDGTEKDGEEGGEKDGAKKDGAETADEHKPETMKVGVLKLSRKNEAEKWLIASLLKIEPDLDEFADKTMIFAVYGRGRAMPPYIGKGITVENLVDCAFFFGGACSCQVKDQNPGMDLLMKWDWDATAEAWAKEDPEFQDGPFGYQEFEPDQ